jgi:hypothetical protein
MDPRSGSSGRHRRGVYWFEPNRNSVVGSHLGNRGNQLGDDRAGRLVHRCATVWKKAASSTGALSAARVEAAQLARALGLAVPEFDVSALDSGGHGMGAVIGAQLREDMRDVVLDGFLRDEKLGGDLSIAVAGRDQA